MAASPKESEEIALPPRHLGAQAHVRLQCAAFALQALIRLTALSLAISRISPSLIRMLFKGLKFYSLVSIRAAVGQVQLRLGRQMLQASRIAQPFCGIDARGRWQTVENQFRALTPLNPN